MAVKRPEDRMFRNQIITAMAVAFIWLIIIALVCYLFFWIALPAAIEEESDITFAIAVLYGSMLLVLIFLFIAYAFFVHDTFTYFRSAGVKMWCDNKTCDKFGWEFASSVTVIGQGVSSLDTSYMMEDRYCVICGVKMKLKKIRWYD